MTRVKIETEVELYPETVIRFREDDPGYWDRHDAPYAMEVPDELAARWKQARDTWRAVQQEIDQWYIEQGR